MSAKTGWLEKHDKGRVVSMVEVQYHRVKVKKTGRRKKGQPVPGNYRDESLYYVLDKRVSYGDLSLTGKSVFTKGEIIEIVLFVVKHQAQLRVLSRTEKTESFMELNRPLFRAQVKFAAINKGDFEHVRALEEKRIREEAVFPGPRAPQPPSQNSLKMTFKRT